jgi:hypothetical protein
MRRVWALVDRRFYSSRYDATRMLAAFDETLHTETKLNDLHTHLVAVMAETIQPEHVSLWLREPARTDSRGAGE